MDLILWRHADAEDGAPDLARPLTAKGRRQAEEIAAWLDARLPRHARILVSPALRAQETARALNRTFEIAEALAPGSTVAAVLGAAKWPNARDAVVVVGHQPTLGGLVSFLIAGREDYWTVKKSALWWLSNRDRGGHTAVAIRAVMDPDFL